MQMHMYVYERMNSDILVYDKYLQYIYTYQ